MAAAVQHRDNTGVTVITAKQWPDAFSGEAQTAEKFAVLNVGSRALSGLEARIVQVGTSDGDDQMRIASDALAPSATVIPPFNLQLSEGASGGVWPSTGVRGYVIDSLAPSGESGPSVEATFTVNDVTKKANLTWTQVPGATGYKIFRTDTPGTFGPSTLRATVGAVGSFVDDGSATSAGSPRPDNTTAGPSPNYGSPPPGLDASLGPVAVGLLNVGEQFIYWVNRVIPAGTPEAGNPRLAEVQFKET